MYPRVVGYLVVPVLVVVRYLLVEYVTRLVVTEELIGVVARGVLVAYVIRLVTVEENFEVVGFIVVFVELLAGVAPDVLIVET